jgi:malonyl-CoA O-methyltransferase
MARPYLVEKRVKRRAFERAARTYDAAAALQREVAQRLLERLDYVKFTPEVILDAGAGTGFGSRQLKSRYSHSSVIALDIAQPMLKLAQSSGAALVCADVEQLPLAPASVNMIWCNLTLQWSNAPESVFCEARRVLQPGGLYFFSTFGPDTLKELRAAWVDEHTHVNLFFDMHDLGDLLLSAGLSDPVMEREQLTVTYSDVTDLMRDLKAIGAQNATAGRRTGLTGRARLERVKENYERFRLDGKLPATFEVIFGHAWKPEARRSPSGKVVIEIKASD